MQMLEQLGLQEADSAELAKRMEKVDVVSGDQEGIIRAVGSYLKEGLGVAAEEAEQALEPLEKALGQVLPSLGIVPSGADGSVIDEASGDVLLNGDTEKKTVVIEDVKAFKANMPLSAGARPVKDLSEFEELGAKL